MILLVVVSLFLAPILGGEVPTNNSDTGPRPPNSISKRIIGGRPVSIVRHPWLVSIQKYGSHICGGTIISSSVVLTAAHCVDDKIHSLRVRANSSFVDDGGSVHRVVRARRHERYQRTEQGHQVNDIALLKVSPSFPLSVINLSPIDLAFKGNVYVPGTIADIAGWGLESEEGGSLGVLMDARVSIVDSRRCSKTYGEETGDWMDANGLICAAAPGSDACTGDSGGPLIVQNVQVGIVSYGKGCATIFPGVYTSVAQFRDWIDENTKVLG